MKRLVPLKTRAESFCAKLNDGLAAVAIVLAMLVFIVGTYRTFELLEISAEEGYAMNAYYLEGMEQPDGMQPPGN